LHRHFYAWATAYTGMPALQRKQRSNFRHQTAAETAAPVIVCAAGKGLLDEADWQFAGIVRSNSVRTVDDGMG
jgi:TPP-dependent 2-oxoacid decarboxylase